MRPLQKRSIAISGRTASTLAAGVGGYLAARSLVRWRRRFDFRDKSVLITGGSRGLGLVLARQFAQEGARVTVCARNAEQLAVAERDLRLLGGEVLAVQCDLTSREQVEGMIAGVSRHFGGIDVLVNNAGTIEVGPMQTMTLATFETAMKTHFWAPLHATLAVLPQMRRRGAGRIVNISSIGGKIAVPHLLPYSASKFALVGLSEGLRAELLQDNIYVTTVCPGLMRTGSARNALFKGRHREEFAWFVLSDALPATSIGAIRAARQIIRGCRYGQGELVLSLPAKLAVTLHDLFPNIALDFSAFVNRLLPSPGGIGTHRLLGRDSETPLTRSILTQLDREAAIANNQVEAESI